jgi:hypothetical protein
VPEIRIVLTWNGNGGKLDLDPHLSGPTCGIGRYYNRYDGPPPGGEQGDPEELYIYMREGVLVTGEYDVWVHNRSGKPDFGVSEAVVKVFQGERLIGKYAVSGETDFDTTTLDIWRVVNIMIWQKDGTDVRLNREGHGFLSTEPVPVGGSSAPPVPPCS